jgi:hypothetical protein
MAKNQPQNSGRSEHTEQGRSGRLATQSTATQAARPGEGDAGRQHPGAESGGWASMSEFKGRVRDFGDSAGEMVSEHPMVAVLTGFGLGFGLGFALATLLAPREEPSWSTRHLADSFSEFTHALRHMPKMTADYVSSALHRR